MATIDGSSIKKLIVACDAGMGSSVMLAVSDRFGPIPPIANTTRVASGKASASCPTSASRPIPTSSMPTARTAPSSSRRVGQRCW